jgi:hypothetical protein
MVGVGPLITLLGQHCSSGDNGTPVDITVDACATLIGELAHELGLLKDQEVCYEM